MSDEDKPKKPGRLNIAGLFEAEAASLLQAVLRGRLLHKTKNIRDSGELLESLFRKVIGSRLPPHTQLAHGYLFDVDSKCTPQIDAMLLSAEDNHPMLIGDGGGIYAPFTACKAFVEIKSSVGNASKQLSQTANIAAILKKMRSALFDQLPSRFALEQVASVLLFAETGTAKIDEFAKWYGSASGIHPTVVVFLDEALVIARRPRMYEFTEMQGLETLETEQVLSGATPWLYRPAVQDQTERRGRVLLWLYYFLLFCATRRQIQSASARVTDELASSEVPPVTAFIRAANLQTPLIPVRELSTAKGKISEQ